MSIKKYTDWSTWWDGLRTNLIKCAGTTGTSWLGSIAVDGIHIPGMPHIGLDWRQAVGLFSVHLGSEIFSYMKNVQPKVVIENVQTQHLIMGEDGKVKEIGSSQTITTTPVVEEKQNEKTNPPPPTGS